MKAIILAIAANLLDVSSATADVKPLVKPESMLGVAVNNPLMWQSEQRSIGASLYVRFMPKHVVRANLSQYAYDGGYREHVLRLGDEYRGRNTDLSVGWIYFPRRAFDGPSYELGVVWRGADTHMEADPRVSRITRGELARVLVGWSWLWRDHVFVAVAIGASAGKVTGSQWEPFDREVAAWTADFEGYFRVGVAFGH